MRLSDLAQGIKISPRTQDLKRPSFFLKANTARFLGCFLYILVVHRKEW